MKDEDIEVKQWPTARRGGQHVGTPVAVVVMHKPTGIGVIVDSERSMHASKARAIGMLRVLVERGESADPVAAAMEAWAQELEDGRSDILRAINVEDPGVLPETLLKLADAAYPFGERKYHPYKAWLAERKVFREAIAAPAPPSADEAAVCEVARDMVLDGRLEEARVLLEQAPNRLARKCPACGAGPGDACVEYEYEDPPVEGFGMYPTGKTELLVPHHARLDGHRDAGPVFGGGR